MQTIYIKDFTLYPLGRSAKFGETSGESFREKFLEPAFKSGELIIVNFDGTAGYGSSFLEEAFGGLVRTLKIPAETILTKLILQSSDDDTICDEVKEYMFDASQHL